MAIESLGRIIMAEHGTVARYQQHIDNNEEACDECKIVRREYQELYRQGLTKRRTCSNCFGGMNHQSVGICSKCKRRGVGRRPECGTVAGYIWHVRTLHEEPCVPCGEAREEQRPNARIKVCLTKDCSRKVYLKSKAYCAVCIQQVVTTWETKKGIKVPVYQPLES